MASIRPRTTRAGVTTWSVLYRHGQGGLIRQASKTFVDEESATRFKTLIDALGPDRALEALRDDNQPQGITVDQLATRWLASKTGEVTPRILTGYRRDYENWIQRSLGHREAATITEIDVQEWVDSMKGKLSPKSIADRHAILHQMYRWGSARSRGLVPRNPCRETELPRREKTNPKGLRIPELHALLTAADKVDHDTGDVIAFMASTGWRTSEVLALTAGAVEDDGTTVYVHMERVLRREVGLTEGGKSRAAVRRIRVIGPGVAVLRRRVVGLAPGDLVFTMLDRRPGVKNRRRPWNPTSFRDRRWPDVVKAAGLEDRAPTPHWLRHTHVALCHAAGMSLAEIQRRLGHEDIQTTINIYGRMIDEMTDEAATRLDALFTPQPTAVEGAVVEEKMLG